MDSSDHLSANELETRMRKRIAELEKTNQELLAEVLEHRLAEEALRESEERYRTLFDSIYEGFCIIEKIATEAGKPKNFRYIAVNSAFEKHTGLKNVLGKTILDLVPEAEQSIVEIHDRVALTGEPIRFETYAASLDLWIDTYAFRIDDPKFCRVAVIFRNVNERKRAEEALKKVHENLEEKVKERTGELEKACSLLKEREDRLKALFRLLPIGVSIVDKERNILDANLALERILGLSRSDLIKGKRAAKKYLKSDGTELSYEDFLNVRSLKDKGSIQSSEIGIIKEDGSTVWTDVNATYLPIYDGQVVITTRDITEHRQEEHRIHRYNSVLMGINRIFGGVVRAESERDLGSACLSIALGITGSQIGFIVEVGKDGTLHNIAISKRCFCQGLMDDRIEHPSLSGDSILHGPYDRVIDTGKSFFTNDPWSYPDSIDLPQDHPELKSFLVVPLIQEGKTTGMIVVANREGGYSSEQQEDLEAIAPAVTQALWRKKAEETLAKIATARQKEIHHRIKNNLQVISSLLDLQAEKFNNRERLENSEIVEAFRESQDRVMSIAFIHEELHEGRGDDALNFSPYLQRLLQNLFHTHRLGNTEICLNLDLEENIFFNMDIAVPLGMIVNELISNSFKYAFPGRKTGEIQIKLFREETKDKANDKDVPTRRNTKYTLIVSDNGIGIPENIDFENPETLGLQLVNLLVDQLDGEVELKRGNGTEFTVRFNNMDA
jgi:PAS domain S-box-containing protein